MLRLVFIFPFLIVPLISATAVSQDTTYVYGGPRSIEGKFETAAGEPDRQGWVGVDLSAPPSPRWQVENYNCANLDTGQSDNHAWWCGEDLPSCGGDDPDGGYGNGYEEYLDYYAIVSDEQVGTTISVSAVLNHDSEPGYDYLYLQYEDSIGMQIDWACTGQESTVTVHRTISFEPGDYVLHPDSAQPSCHLRWCGTSDGAWSDQDCNYPSIGLAQIDNITISGDNGVQTTLEDCEGPVALWKPVSRPGVGNFSKVWPLLDDADPDNQNDTPQFAFIDDGFVVPGTGGTLCDYWCYGPGGYCVTATGGLVGEQYYLHNEIWSPPIAMHGPTPEWIILRFDAYMHSAGWEIRPMVIVTWHVRSTSDPSGTSGWTGWRYDLVSHISFHPEYFSIEENIAELLTPDCHYIQLSLTAKEVTGGIWIQPTPAPYLDNVCVYSVSGLSELPDLENELRLAAPTPNPFNPNTTVEFLLPEDGRVTVTVCDLRGQLIRLLLDEKMEAETHSTHWDGRDTDGKMAAAGIYLFRLEAGGVTVTKKGVLVK